MAYTPINWQTGDTITADKLNRCDNGWGYENTLLFSETVTTVAGQYGNEAQLAYSQIISDDEIVVTFDGTDYVCQNRETSTPNSNFFGGIDSSGNYDFSTYPFAIVSVLGPGNIVATETAGTHAIAAGTQSFDVSNSFVNAVAFHAIVGTTTFQEIDDALAAGRLVVVSVSGSFGSGCLLVCSTDKTGVPLEVNAVNATSEGVSAITYLASSASSPIVAN